MFQKVVRLAEGIENETPVHTALLLYKAKTLRGLGPLDVARDTLNGHYDERRLDPGDLLRAIRYEQLQVYKDLGEHRRTRSEFEKLYAEKPQILRM